jgi:hemerythrin
VNRETETFLPCALIVNIPEIDDQHAELFARLSKLKDICIEANTLPSGEAESILEILRVHCATEERLAKESGLVFTEHAKKHKAHADCDHQGDQGSSGRQNRCLQRPALCRVLV